MSRFFDVFISYGRADSKAFATKLCNCLGERGLTVWFDQNDIPLGVDFENQIDEGIEKAHNFIFIIAPHSVNSPYCRKEIELAVKHNKRIIPILHIEEIHQDIWQQRNPNGTQEQWKIYQEKGLHTSFQNLHPAISKINPVYFRDEHDNFEVSFEGLVNLIDRHTNYVQQHTRLLAQALEWERNHKQTTYLLIGEERQEAEAWLKVRFKDEQPPCLPTDLHCEFICESKKNADNLMSQVFISYAPQDTEFMKQIRHSLMREGLTVWTNKTDIKTGSEFQKEINKGLEGADNVIYLISADSLQSEYCQKEITRAFFYNKRIINLLIKPTELNQIPDHIGSLEFIDLTKIQDQKHYQTNIDQVLNLLHQDAKYYEQHKVLLVKALKWERQNHNPSILLRGYDLKQAEAWLKVGKQRTEHPPLALHEAFITASTNQPPESSLDVFISYSRADSDFARKLNEALQIQGKTTWFDQESMASGADFQAEIYRGIENCDNFLFIISPKSVHSPDCTDAVNYAQKLNKRFVTVLHRSISANTLHPELAKVQWIDFNNHDGDFIINFSELVRTIDTDREHVKSHTKWSQRAMEWDSKGRDDNFLLRGSNLQEAQYWLQQWLMNGALKQPEPTTLQTEYLIESYKVETAQIKAEKARQQAELNRQKAEIKFQRTALGSVSLALLVAIGLGIAAFRLYRKALVSELNAQSTSSEALFSSNQTFDALIVALRVRQNLQRIGWVDQTTKVQVESVLRQAVYDVVEYNRFSGHNAGVYGVAISPDRNLIASASEDNTIKLWKRNGTLLKTLTGHKNGVYAVTFSPDGELIASASEDNTIKLWKNDGTFLKTFTGHTDGVYAVTFSPDGKFIASASEDNTIKLWKRDGTFLKTLTGHTDEVYAVTFSPDGEFIASASEDNTIKLWQRDGTLLKTLTGHTDGVEGVAFSPDGQLMASASQDNTIKLWKRDGTLLKTLTGHTDGVEGVAFSPDGTFITSASEDNTIKLWRRDGTLLKTLIGHQDGVDAVTFTPDGKLIASASEDKTVRIWNLDDRLLEPLIGHTDEVQGVAFSPDGKLIASASWDNTIKLWNQDTTELKTLKGHNDGVDSVTFSPDGQFMASASEDNTIKLWKRDGTLLKTLTGHTDRVNTVTFSSDGTLIASASEDNTIKLWKRDGTLLKTLTGHTDGVDSVTFSPDGNLIASASQDNTIKLWKRDGILLKTITGHTDGVEGVAFSPDGQLMASVSDDNTIKLWKRDGMFVKTLTGHTDEVEGVAFSFDGRMIASGSRDQTVKLWTREGKLLATLKDHSQGVLAVTFSPNSKIVASASQDGTVILWDLDQIIDLDQVLAYGCNWVRDYLKNNAEVERSDRRVCDRFDAK
ncbi:MAG TPA: type IV secretion protein Rhs [Cyanobacteria bacterium UBA11370]|nr:type IV secretion protein Rhs [Cyanobacteria bacterium UBA11370]HBY75819.1 type IV secretion protein Rhs [Cyanobacteria bacterium UBA11148]